MILNSADHSGRHLRILLIPRENMALGADFDTTLTFASAHHRAQVRKGTEVPRVAHLLAVASLAVEHGAIEDEAIAALLHDVIEDHGVTFKDLEKLFGRAAADFVSGCSDTDEIPKPPWRGRKDNYVAHVREATTSVRLVSMCDKLHNARSILADLRQIGDELWSRYTGGRDGSLLYRALVEAYRVAVLIRVVLDGTELAMLLGGFDLAQTRRLSAWKREAA